MKYLFAFMRRSGKKEQLFVIASYIVNIMIIAFFMMILTSFQNLTNDSLSPNDYNQAIIMLSSMLGVSLITIIFFQWLVGIIFKNLYDSRERFNLNLRLMGLGNKKLFFLYLKEYVLLQAVSVPIGSLSAAICYNAISSVFHFEVKYINLKSIYLSLLIHLGIVLFFLIFILGKASKTNLVQQMRGIHKDSPEYRWSVTSSVKSGLAILIMATIIYANANLDLYKDKAALLNLFLILVYFLTYDFTFWIFRLLFDWIYRLFHFNLLGIANKLYAGNYRKVKSVNYMMVVSLLLFLGLTSLFKTVRNSAYVVANNLRFASVEYSDTIQPVADHENVNDFFSLRLISGELQSSTLRVFGIDSNYTKRFETILLNPEMSLLRQEELNQMIDDPDWNGIIFPDGYISPENLGTEYIADIDGHRITFVVKSGYYINNYAETRCLVSKGFLEKKLGLRGFCNTVVSLAESDRVVLDHATKFTRSELVGKSYEKAVSGTELIELAEYVTISAAVIFLLNLIFVGAYKNKSDITKLRIIGLPAKKALSVYLIYYLMIIVEAFLGGIPLAALLSYHGISLVLNKYYVEVTGLIFSYKEAFLLFLFFLCVSAGSIYLSVGKVNKSDYRQMLREYGN
jgi:hypothetical protein